MPLDPLSDINPGPLVDRPQPLTIRSRWSLKDLMILIALMGLGLAVVGLSGTVFVGVIVAPMVVAPRGQKRSQAYWSLVLYPLAGLLGLYLCRLEAWVALGHPPVASLDDPKGIDAIDFSSLILMLILMGSPFVLLTSFCLTIYRVSSPSRAEWHWFRRSYPLLVMPTIWASCYGILRWDLFRVVSWFMD